MSEALICIGSMATRRILGELAQRYESTAGRRVDVRSLGGVEAAGKVRAGESVDVVVLASGALAKLAAEGRLAGEARDLARSAMAVAVAAGAPLPDISSGAAVRDAILAAPRTAYSTGPSGDHLLALCKRWGLESVLADRLVQAPPGVPVGALVARGDATLGFQQASELQDIPGIVVVGSLPLDIAAVTVFSAAVAAAARDPEAAADLIRFLASPDAAGAYRRHGMEPAAS